jgi:hypothetical protein
LLAPAPSSTSPSSTPSDAPTQITYRHYATLYFIIISTSTESPLALLDFIQVFVEALDRLFENVCELDLIFGYETMHAVLGEMVIGGVVVETAVGRVVEGVRGGGKDLGVSAFCFSVFLVGGGRGGGTVIDVLWPCFDLPSLFHDLPHFNIMISPSPSRPASFFIMISPPSTLTYLLCVMLSPPFITTCLFLVMIYPPSIMITPSSPTTCPLLVMI